MERDAMRCQRYPAFSLACWLAVHSLVMLGQQQPVVPAPALRIAILQGQDAVHVIGGGGGSETRVWTTDQQ